MEIKGHMRFYLIENHKQNRGQIVEKEKMIKYCN